MPILSELQSISHNPLYVNRYYKFILACQAKNNHLDASEYTENHHILPKSIWSEYSSLSDFRWNLAKLTARQHYIAHFILSKCFYGKPGYQMACAFGLMMASNQFQPESRCPSMLYGLSKNRLSIERKGQQLGKSNPFYGKKHTPETIEKIKAANLGRRQSDETKAKRADKNRGKTRSEEFKRRASESSKGNQNSLGSKRSPETKKLISDRQRGTKNPSAKRYTIIDPYGIVFLVEGGLVSFCDKYDLSYQKMKTSIDKGPIMLPNTNYKHTQQTKNCVGWVILITHPTIS